MRPNLFYFKFLEYSNILSVENERLTNLRESERLASISEKEKLIERYQQIIKNTTQDLDTCMRKNQLDDKDFQFSLNNSNVLR